MQFQVPQFIETEDKIVGPFSIRQFIYVAIGAGVSFFLYFFVQTWLWFILSIFVVGGALAFAFLKINGRPFMNVLTSVISFYWRPQKYVWRSENPTVKKEEVMQSKDSGGFMESIASGLALKSTWQSLLTGSKQKKDLGDTKGRYQIMRRLSGDREIARRVDYR